MEGDTQTLADTGAAKAQSQCQWPPEIEEAKNRLQWEC